MKRKALALVVVLAFLFSALVGNLFVNLAKANPVIPRGTVGKDPTPPSIEIKSMEISTEGILLKFKIALPHTDWSGDVGTTYGPLTSVRYVLDSEEKSLNLEGDEYGVVSYSLNLGQLADGEHVLTIIAEGLGYYGTATHDLYFGSTPSFAEVMSTKPLSTSLQVNFSVDNYSVQINSVRVYPVPNIEFLSPENKTYNTTSVPFNFTVNGAASQIAYSLNGEENITITENTTLIGLTNGNYSLTIYVNDEALNIGFSKTIFFGVYKEPEPFPTMLVVIASGASVAVIGIGLVVYFKKRKH
jgi:hypothetical protein